MKNLLKFLSIYIFVLFTSCEAEKNVTKETTSANQNSSEITYEELTAESSEENLNNFIENHVKLSNEIILLVRSENNFNFDNTVANSIASSSNITEFKQALANAGISKYSELGDLILSQSLNASDFKENNKDFTLLNEETKNRMISDALDIALNDNPLNLLPFVPIATPLGRTCAQQFTVDQNRCNRDINRNSVMALIACFGGPWICGPAVFGVAMAGQDCLNDAREDYEACIR